MRAIGDANAQVVQTYRYDPFGGTESAARSVTQPFQYTGEQRNGESGFYYLRARMYVPSMTGCAGGGARSRIGGRGIDGRG